MDLLCKARGHRWKGPLGLSQPPDALTCTRCGYAQPPLAPADVKGYIAAAGVGQMTVEEISRRGRWEG